MSDAPRSSVPETTPEPTHGIGDILDDAGRITEHYAGQAWCGLETDRLADWIRTLEGVRARLVLVERERDEARALALNIVRGSHG